MSIKFQHTPGPWVAVIRGNNRLGARQAARLLNLPPYYLTKPRCRVSKRIPYYRVGQMVRFRMSELIAWADTQGGAHE